MMGACSFDCILAAPCAAGSTCNTWHAPHAFPCSRAYSHTEHHDHFTADMNAHLNITRTSSTRVWLSACAASPPPPPCSGFPCSVFPWPGPPILTPSTAAAAAPRAPRRRPRPRPPRSVPSADASCACSDTSWSQQRSMCLTSEACLLAPAAELLPSETARQSLFYESNHEHLEKSCCHHADMGSGNLSRAAIIN